MPTDGWQPIETAPKDGTIVHIKIDIESVRAYYDKNFLGAGIGAWVLAQPLHMETIFHPTQWRPA